MPQKLVIARAVGLKGETFVSGDKSISHRALIFSGLGKGTSRIKGFLNGSDCLATLEIVKQLGITVNKISPTEILLKSDGFFKEPEQVLDCQNSGTTIRLLCGLLAGQNFFSALTGSEQIRRRPMGRVIEPLTQMHAQIYGRKNNTLAPISILPSKKLMGQTFHLGVASAQVKSCLLLAGLFAENTTTVIEPGPARDHTERMLKAMGAPIAINGNAVSIQKLASNLQPMDISIPGDMSSAAFLLVAASIIENSHIMIKNVGINRTRNGIIEALTQMNADVSLHNLREEAGEPIADINVKTANLKGAIFDSKQVVRMIDELPILAVAATQAHGTTLIKDAAELKVKETNRIDTTVSELRKMGANIEATEDGFIVEGPTPLKGTVLDSHGDHRLAMMGVIAGLCAKNDTTVIHTDVIKDSFPTFTVCLRELGAKLEEQ